MTGPLGNSEFCFPRISMFPESQFKMKCLLHGSVTNHSFIDFIWVVFLYMYVVALDSDFQER